MIAWWKSSKSTSSFSVSAIYFFLKYYATDRHKQAVLTLNTSKIRFGSPRCEPFLTLRGPRGWQTLLWESLSNTNVAVETQLGLRVTRYRARRLWWKACRIFADNVSSIFRELPQCTADVEEEEVKKIPSLRTKSS